MRRGRFEQADGGTLFLDEIGDMPPELQTRLLRVLSDGQFYRVGGHQPIKANVRVIAATHQDLEARVKQGLFREDLFHRLNVIRLRLPPLRERREDIPLLAQAFPREERARARRRGQAAVGCGAANSCRRRTFPGNVRQLENLCHWLTVMAPAVNVEVNDLPPELRVESAARRPARTGSRRSSAKSSRAEPRRNGLMDELGRPVREGAHYCARSHTPAGAASRRRICSAGPQHAHPQNPGARARCRQGRRRFSLSQRVPLRGNRLIGREVEQSPARDRTGVRSCAAQCRLNRRGTRRRAGGSVEYGRCASRGCA